MSPQASTTKKRVRPTTAAIEEAVKEVIAGNRSINKQRQGFEYQGPIWRKLLRRLKTLRKSTCIAQILVTNAFSLRIKKIYL